MNPADFNVKVYPFRDKIFRFALRMLQQTEEAEDLVQEVFIRIWKMRERLDEYRSIEALVMITTKNLCLDRLKTRKRSAESLETGMPLIERLPEEPKPDHSDLVHSVKEAMNSLPEQVRMIVHLRDIEGYGYDEIAQIMGMEENAIRVSLSRARKKIRDLLLNQKQYEYQRS